MGAVRHGGKLARLARVAQYLARHAQDFTLLTYLPHLGQAAHVSNSDLLTTAEVAERTGWSITSINRWALRGELPYERKLRGRTGSYLFRASVVQERLRTRESASPIVRENDESAA